jgi:glycosyltransferase involved in cell wall biosynthesis
LATDGIPTFVAYTEVDKPPGSLSKSEAKPIALDATLDSWGSIRATIAEVRRRRVRVIYYTDRGWWHWSLPLLRMAGVRRIVAHDHTSGARTVPRGIKSVAKWVKARIPFVRADVIATVSEYVARRHREVGLTQPARVVRVWNGLTLPAVPSLLSRPELLGSPGRLVALCVCRAAREKGVDHLLRAFDIVTRGWPAGQPLPLLVYVGDGPMMDELRALRESLDSRDSIVFAGYRSDVPAFIAHADVSVVPSVWQDACPLGVLEPMSHAKPVIASSVGGVPELIDGPEVGDLVPPGDPAALAAALGSLLRDPIRQRRVGLAARQRVERHFRRETQIDALVSLVRGAVWPAKA